MQGPSQPDGLPGDRLDQAPAGPLPGHAGRAGRLQRLQDRGPVKRESAAGRIGSGRCHRPDLADDAGGRRGQPTRSTAVAFTDAPEYVEGLRQAAPPLGARHDRGPAGLVRSLLCSRAAPGIYSRPIPSSSTTSSRTSTWSIRSPSQSASSSPSASRNYAIVGPFDLCASDPTATPYPLGSMFQLSL